MNILRFCDSSFLEFNSSTALEQRHLWCSNVTPFFAEQTNERSHNQTRANKQKKTREKLEVKQGSEHQADIQAHSVVFSQSIRRSCDGQLCPTARGTTGIECAASSFSQGHVLCIFFTKKCVVHSSSISMKKRLAVFLLFPLDSILRRFPVLSRGSGSILTKIFVANFLILDFVWGT